MGAALAAPLIGAVSQMAGGMGGGASSGGGAAPAKPQPAAPKKTADVLKSAKTSREEAKGKKASLSGLRIKRNSLGGGSGSGLNI